MLSDHWPDVAAAYDLGPVRGEPVFAARGAQGRVWRLQTGRGSYAVKELIVRQCESDAAQDFSYQEAVLAAGSVLLPDPIRTRQGRVLIELGSHQLRVYRWMDMLPADDGQDPGLIGGTFAAIHRVRHHTTRPLVGWYTDAVGLDRWNALLDASRAASAPFTPDLAAEIPFLVQLEGWLEPPAHLQTCHRDLWSANLLPVSPAGVCVIDWENCGLAEPVQELPLALFDFCLGDQGRTEAFYGAYLDAGGPARIRRRGDFTMMIAQFGHFWEQALENYLAPGASEETKAHSIARITEAMVTPLRPEHIEAVLDWTSAVH